MSRWQPHADTPTRAFTGQNPAAGPSPGAGGSSMPPPPNATASRHFMPPWVTQAVGDHEWQKLWLNVSKFGWRTLGLIPAGDATVLEAATILCAIGSHVERGSISAIDLRALQIADLHHVMHRIAKQRERGERVIVVLGSTHQNATAANVARSLDAVILCVTLGQSEQAAAERVLDEVGRGHFLGSVVLAPRSSGTNGVAAPALPQGTEQKPAAAPLRTGTFPGGQPR